MKLPFLKIKFFAFLELGKESFQKTESELVINVNHIMTMGITSRNKEFFNEGFPKCFYVELTNNDIYFIYEEQYKYISSQIL